MRFLLDNNAPEALIDVLKAAGHEAHFSREELDESAPDIAVVRLAIKQEAIVITWDRRDFEKLSKKHIFDLLTFRCDEVDGAARLKETLLYVEFAHKQAADLGRPMHASIGKAGITVYE
jgi:predicted nuclease of predicted toxin-antitoxin system